MPTVDQEVPDELIDRVVESLYLFPEGREIGTIHQWFLDLDSSVMRMELLLATCQLYAHLDTETITPEEALEIIVKICLL